MGWVTEYGTSKKNYRTTTVLVRTVYPGSPALEDQLVLRRAFKRKIIHEEDGSTKIFY